MSNSSRVDALHSWNDDWTALRVAILGLGVTGFSVADTLAELGADSLVLASRAEKAIADVLAVIGVPLVSENLAEALADFDPELVVVSPGFAPTHPLVVWATNAGVPVWGDVELAWRVRDKVVDASGKPAEWLAVTGTNGKTTTVQLATAMLIEDGKRVIACGNVGVPVLDAIRDPVGWDVLVVELSSFQLHYLDSLSAWASVCLNIADDHLDWHGGPDAYRADKAKIYTNTRMACIYNLADETTKEMVEDAEVIEGCRAVGFGLAIPGPSDLGVVDEFVVDRAFHEDRHHSAIELTTLHELQASGLSSPHMVANVLAASALARSLDTDPAAIRRALGQFRVDHHRTEVIREVDGVLWVNDSKATNPHAAQAALSAYDPVVWVVGGLLKGVEVDELVRANAKRLRAAVIIGTDRQSLVEAFARHAPGVPVFEVDTPDTKEVMPTVVRLAVGVALQGDTVLLAPAAASMDQFTDYSDRGVRFTEAVQSLVTGSGGQIKTGERAPDDDEASPPQPL